MKLAILIIVVLLSIPIHLSYSQPQKIFSQNSVTQKIEHYLKSITV
jgi:hypothetical protein